MKYSFLILLTSLMSAQAYALGDVAPCNRAGQNGCPATFKAGTRGCSFCASCGTGTVTHIDGVLKCSITGATISVDANGNSGRNIQKKPAQFKAF